MRTGRRAWPSTCSHLAAGHQVSAGHARRRVRVSAALIGARSSGECEFVAMLLPARNLYRLGEPTIERVPHRLDQLTGLRVVSYDNDLE